jgi:UDP-N-acetylglucosamine--N-acetylmuramyl-(pentapeptide) pyrophosphoryl-undecaprenol N-acetylglucosamine transferase
VRISEAKKVLIVAGSTGGHLFPAMSLGLELQNHYGYRPVVLINERSQAFIETYDSFDFVFVKVRSIGNKWNVFQVCAAIIKAFRVLRRYRPDAIVGFGSSITFPVILAGWFMRIPRLIHEQNAEFGIANNISRRFSDFVALSFPISQVKNRKKYIITGNILRPEIDLYIRSKKPYAQRRLQPARVLILGGSQGSQTLNTAIADMLELCQAEELKRIALYHLIGHNSAETAFIEKYHRIGVEAHVWQFLADVGKLYAIADIAITRAGAGTVSELIEFAVPSILIPYPYAQNHQLQNARYIEQNKGGIIIQEHDLSPVLLKETLLSLIAEKDRCVSMHAALKHLQKGKTVQHLSKIVLHLIKESPHKK